MVKQMGNRKNVIAFQGSSAMIRELRHCYCLIKQANSHIMLEQRFSNHGSRPNCDSDFIDGLLTQEMRCAIPGLSLNH